MEEKIDRIEKNINDLIEIVGAIKDNMATKHDLEEMATKEDLAKVREELVDKIRLNVVLKDIRDPSTYRVGLNATGVDQFIPWTYSHDTLIQTLP